MRKYRHINVVWAASLVPLRGLRWAALSLGPPNARLHLIRTLLVNISSVAILLYRQTQWPLVPRDNSRGSVLTLRMHVPCGYAAAP